MRPVRVEFQAFGPYAGHEVVDFEAISKRGLFLICGKTGIGKTMILDAMTFALYGKSSGHGRDDFEAMRCTHAAFEQPTFVKFEFENDGSFYLFERRLERKRKNLAASCQVMEKNIAGVWEPLFENAKEKALNEKALEIIGLEYEQFRQVIVLPQGQFERLLTSNSDEKEKILTSIFGEDKWQDIAERLYAEVEARKERLKGIKEKIVNSLREEQCASLSELELLISQKENRIKTLDEEYKAADYERTIRDLQAELLLVKRFGDLHKAQVRVKELEALAAEKELWEQRVKASERAQKLRIRMEAADRASEEFRHRQETEKELENAVRNAGALAEASVLALREYLQNEKEFEKKKALRIKYEEKRPDYEGLESAAAELKEKEAEEKQARKAQETAKQRYEACSARIITLNREYTVLKEEHGNLLERYLTGITGELAGQLTEGKPCPVCGSVSHPHKAVQTDRGITRSVVDDKKLETEQEYTKLQSAINDQTKAKAALDAQHTIVEAKHAEVAAQSTKLEGMKKSLVAGIDTLGMLNERIHKLSDEITAFAEKKRSLEECAQKAQGAFTEANAKIEEAQKETKHAHKAYQASAAAVSQGLKEHGFESEKQAKELLLEAEEMEKLQRRISEYAADIRAANVNLSDLSEELKDQKEPDEEACREMLEKASAAKDAYTEARGILNSEIGRLKNKKKLLEAEGEGMEEKIREAEEDFAFAKKVRGDSGTGLQRYVLGIMFSSVVAAANQMLELVHGGRYRLYRSDEKAQGTNKRGLELKVFDKYSEDHEGRFVSTLSGGEKFLASLALSIGMSTVAQKTGIRIEALFIDEGFGSLDEDSVGDAMNILSSIQEANGLVGIISHVQLLQDRIPTKLRVEETDKGSRIVQTIG